MEKNSFSLLETILSIVILAILLISFNGYFFNNKDLNQLFVDLNDIENRFDSENYSSFDNSSKNITIILDELNTLSLEVNSYNYENNQIKINKYEK